MLEHKPQSFAVGDEVLYKGDQWLIRAISGDKSSLESTSDPRKSDVAYTHDLLPVAHYDELADEFDDV